MLSQQGRLMVAERAGFGGQHSCSDVILVPMVRQRWAATVGRIQTAKVANATSRATMRANIHSQYKDKLPACQVLSCCTDECPRRR